MPQSLAKVLLHVVFGTKQRQPTIAMNTRAELHYYVGGILRNIGCAPIIVGGVEDHVHLFFQLSRTETIAKVIESVKTGSSKWMKTQGVSDFAWQSGYAVFSVSVEETAAIVTYIRNQEEHHKKVSFQDEYRQFLREAGVEFDEKYMWD